MTTDSLTALTTLACIVLISGCAASGGGSAVESGFTGETLTLLYVKDVRKSAAFYEAVGFELDYFYDYETDAYTRNWKQLHPPDYAEVVQPGIRIALTTTAESDKAYGGGVRHYFMVEDVDSHFRMIQKNGIVATPNEVEERPWMNFITVVDPDNHQIVFGTKNQVYYDEARERIDKLDRR